MGPDANHLGERLEMEGYQQEDLRSTLETNRYTSRHLLGNPEGGRCLFLLRSFTEAVHQQSRDTTDYFISQYLTKGLSTVMAPKKPKTAFSPSNLKEVMSRLGLDPERFKRENTPEVMIPKMAIVGFLDTIKQFAEIGKQTVNSSVQGLNPAQMRLFLDAIRGTLDMVDQSLLAYEASLRQAKVKDVVDTIAKSVRSDTETPNDDDDDEEDGNEENETDDDDSYQDYLPKEEDDEFEKTDNPSAEGNDAFFSSKKRSVN